MTPNVKTILIAAVAATALAGTAHAQRASAINGARLAGICSSGNQSEIASCDAYITGVTDSAVVYQKLRPENGGAGGTLPGYVCIPGQVTGEQLRRQYVAWMGNHRDQADTVAAGTVLTAMLDIYPCRR